MIIAEGGLTARWSTLRPVLGPAVDALHGRRGGQHRGRRRRRCTSLLGLDWRLALLYGAVLSSTDAAAVFATLRRLRLPPRLVATLEAESGINDAPVVLLVVLLSATDRRRATRGGSEALLVVLRAGAPARRSGFVVGMAGRVGAAPGRAARRPACIRIAAVGLTVLAYAVGAVAHASGFLAVYVAGVVLGNARLPHRQAILGFADGLAWLAQIGLFVLLGLLASPGRLADAVVPALVDRARAGAAGPAAVGGWSRATPFRVGLRDQAFLSWAGLRGAVPIVLATIPLSAGVPGATRLFDVVFVLVVVFTLVQGGTLPPVARLAAGHRAGRGHRAAGGDRAAGADAAPTCCSWRCRPGSRLAGVHLDELRLPVGAAVTLVLRDGAGFVPGAGHPAARSGTAC